MPEVQKHGFDFENWVKETFFAKSHIIYTEKWDVPSGLNISVTVPGAFQRLRFRLKLVNTVVLSGLAMLSGNLRTKRIFC